MNNEKVTSDWYKSVFLDSTLNKEDIAINSGLNIKTISNMFNSTKKEVVIDASNEHYDSLYTVIQSLVNSTEDLDLTLTIKLKGVSVDLNVSESLIVINTLAVKRSALRGGLWSTAGKRVEKPLMQTICKLYSVPDDCFEMKMQTADTAQTFQREIDFYLINKNQKYKCEVKLMGRGNPESADAVIARDSSIFVADKLSDTNKAQLDSLNIKWVELRNKIGFRKFKDILKSLKIPYRELNKNNLDSQIDKIFKAIFK